MTKLVIAWDGNTPVYASQELIKWRINCQKLRELYESLDESNQSEKNEVLQEYYALLCKGN